MMRTHRIVALLTIFAMLSVAPFTQAQKPNSSEAASQPEWLLVKTDHFAVLSNTDPDRAKLIAYKLEQFRYVFSLLLPEIFASEPSLTRVRVYRDSSSYSAALPQNLNINGAIAGFFERSGDLITINDLFNISDNVSFHEYTHLLTRIDDDNYPLWFIEGIAQFYETFEIAGKTARIGEITTSRLHSLRINNFIPLEKLLEFKSYTQIQRDTTLDMFYAESWALVNYLILEGRRAQLVEYLNLVHAGGSIEKSIRAAFQSSPDKLEDQLKDYLEKSKFKVFTCEFESEKVESDVEITSLENADKLLKPVDSSSGKIEIRLKRDDKRSGAVILDPTTLQSRIGLKTSPSNRPVNLTPNDPNLAAKAKDALKEFNEANQLYGDGKMQAALAKYEKAIKADPEFAPAYMLIGNIYSEAGLYDLAHLAYDKARAVAPNYAGTYLNFAVTQYQQGNSTDAEASFRIALSLYPSSAAAHLGLGNIYLDRRLYSRARTEYAKTINLTRGKGTEALNAFIGLGAVYFYLGQYEQAKQQYQSASSLDPENGTWHRAFGDNCRMLKQYNEAETAYLRALELNPKDVKARESLDWLHKYSEYQRLYQRTTLTK